MTFWQIIVYLIFGLFVFAGLVLVLDYETIFHTNNVVSCTLALGLLLAFLRAMYVICGTQGKLPPGHLLAVGLVFIWTGVLIRHGVYYFSGAADGPVYHTLGDAFILWALGGFLLMFGGAVALFASLGINKEE
jgi:hypothetical protein